MTRILLIRHGQTDWNRREIFRGRADIPLSIMGLEQARALAARVAEEQPSAVYCSPLSRARLTAEIVAGEGGPRPQLVEGLTDMSYGAWEGHPHEEIRAQDPALYARWVTEPHLVRPPGGEMLAEVRERTLAVLDGIAAGHPGTTVAVVSHRVVNKLLLCAALGVGDEGFWRVRQNTACLNVLEWDAARAAVVLLNDTCHLRGLEQDASDF